MTSSGQTTRGRTIKTTVRPRSTTLGKRTVTKTLMNRRRPKEEEQHEDPGEYDIIEHAMDEAEGFYDANVDLSYMMRPRGSTIRTGTLSYTTAQATGCRQGLGLVARRGRSSS